MLVTQLCPTLCDLMDCSPPDFLPMKFSRQILFWCWILSHFSGVWLFGTMDCSPPVSSIHGILQARLLEWVANTYFQHRDGASISLCLLHYRHILMLREQIFSAHSLPLFLVNIVYIIYITSILCFHYFKSTSYLIISLYEYSSIYLTIFSSW